MNIKKKNERERISIDLPAVPYSLRAFIEKAVTDDRSMMSFVESPIAALRAAGVPIDTDCITRSDTDRLRDVLSNLRNVVKNGKISKDFRFEDVFVISDIVAYQEQKSTSESYAYTTFDHSQDGQSSENKSHTEGGIQHDFDSKKSGLGKFTDIFAPLINPSDLAVITTLMQAKINTSFDIG